MSFTIDPKFKNVQIIGHRGIRALYPEHTATGYNQAIDEYGLKYLDIDVVLTKDMQFLAYHDLIINPDVTIDLMGNYLAHSNDELMRSFTNIKDHDKYIIKNLTLNEIKYNYKIRPNLASKYTSYFPMQEKNVYEPILSLSDVIRLSQDNKDVFYQIEIKNSDILHISYDYETVAITLFNFLKKYNLINKVKIQAFDWRILFLLNQWCSELKTAYLLDEELRTNWYIKFAKSKFSEFLQSKNLFDKKSNIIEIIKCVGGYSYEVEDVLVTPNEINLAHKLDLKVIVWSYLENSQIVDFNTQKQVVLELLNMGVDGFITDNPLLFKGEAND